MPLPGSGAVELLAVFLVCYVLGFVLQGFGSVFDHRVFPLQNQMTSTCLMEGSSVITNPEKLVIYRSKAMRLLKQKGLISEGEGISMSQCDYFFAYCSYVVQLDPRCKKVEKMRAIKGLASQFGVCFSLLAILGILRFLIAASDGSMAPVDAWILMASVAFALLAIWSHFRMRENLVFWIRMVLAMYEVIDDERGGANNGSPVPSPSAGQRSL